MRIKDIAHDQRAEPEFNTIYPENRLCSFLSQPTRAGRLILFYLFLVILGLAGVAAAVGFSSPWVLNVLRVRSRFSLQQGLESEPQQDFLDLSLSASLSRPRLCGPLEDTLCSPAHLHPFKFLKMCLSPRALQPSASCITNSLKAQAGKNLQVSMPQVTDCPPILPPATCVQLCSSQIDSNAGEHVSKSDQEAVAKIREKRTPRSQRVLAMSSQCSTHVKKVTWINPAQTRLSELLPLPSSFYPPFLLCWITCFRGALSLQLKETPLTFAFPRPIDSSLSCKTPFRAHVLERASPPSDSKGQPGSSHGLTFLKALILLSLGYLCANSFSTLDAVFRLGCTQPDVGGHPHTL